MGDKEGAMGDIKSTTKAPSPMSIASANATVGSDGPADAESLGVMPSNRSIIGAQGVPRTGTGGTDSSNNSVMQFANTFLSDMEGVEAVPDGGHDVRCRAGGLTSQSFIGVVVHISKFFKIDENRYS